MLDVNYLQRTPQPFLFVSCPSPFCSRNLCAILLRSFAKAVKGVDIFTREELGDAFRRGYKKVPVQCRTLENLANFKDLVAPVTRRVPNITNYQAFKIYKEGPSMVVTVKKKMHHEDWLGFSEDGKTVGGGPGFSPWRLMHAHAVHLEATPPYELKLVQDEIIHRVDLRQQASWEKLPVAYVGGTFSCFFATSFNESILMCCLPYKCTGIY